MLENKTSQRNFISDFSLDNWKENFVRIKKSKNLFKEYKIEKIDNKLFQTRIFFPAKSIPGEYKVNVYQIKDNLILNKKEKIITLKNQGLETKYTILLTIMQQLMVCLQLYLLYYPVS